MKINIANFLEKMIDEKIEREEFKSRNDVITAALIEWFRKLNTLDIGCGVDAKGDVNIDFQNIFKRFNSKPKNFIVASAVYLPFKEGVFQEVIANHVIEHLSDEEVITCLQDIKLVGKSAVIVVPNVYWKSGSWKYGHTPIGAETRKTMLLSPHKQVFDTIMFYNTLKLVFMGVEIKGVGTWISIRPLTYIFSKISRKITFLSKELVAYCKT